MHQHSISLTGLNNERVRIPLATIRFSTIIVLDGWQGYFLPIYQRGYPGVQWEDAPHLSQQHTIEDFGSETSDRQKKLKGPYHLNWFSLYMKYIWDLR